MRILLEKEERSRLFNFLLEKYNVNNLKELAVKINKPYKTVNHWRYDYKKYIPNYLLEGFTEKVEILDKKPDNWGQMKGGKTMSEKKIAYLEKLWKDSQYIEVRKRLGMNSIKNLNKNQKELIKRSNQTKLKKRERKSNYLEEFHHSFFNNEKVLLNNESVKYSKYDGIKNIKLPQEMSVDLAEEIGIHLGDGCLSFNKKYFSVKTNKKERDYMLNFIFPLYKRLYNLDLKLMELESVVGFEIYSQAFFDFKNKVLKIPYGNKVEKIYVPEEILQTKNKEIYRAFIRGLFDTDGCAGVSRTKKDYPFLTFTIKSEKLIREVGEMLNKLGFIPYVGKWMITLNGNLMVAKWLKEISSNNPKNLAKLQQACSVVDSTRPCGGLNLGSTPSTPISI